ncbi:hypothetical protein [Ruegeria sp.]|uniref:hypothetical protein n=1 Tax=Ruegeria sp. TaxID=1879320 RepID=UPI003B5B06FB
MREEARAEALHAFRKFAPWLLIVGALLLAAFRSVRFGGYFPDDAYITIRFAEHLSQGLGIVWNVDGPPVEGSTSFLQTLLYAAAFKLGLSPAISSYAMNTLGLAALVVILYFTIKNLTGRFDVAAALPLAMFFSGVAFTVHLNSGMETLIFLTLISASFLTSLILLNRRTWTAALGLAVVNFFCLLCRPDAAPFIMGQGLVLGIVALRTWLTQANTLFIRQLAVSFAVLVAMGLTFLAWKYSYFGYVLPNSFYVKASDPLAFNGISPVKRFLGDMFWRIGLLVPLLIFVDWRFRDNHVNQVPARIALLVVPVAAFLAYYTTTLHLVGFFNRFEYPTAVFFWIGLSWLLSSGRSTERMQEFAGRALGSTGGRVLVTSVLLCALAVQFEFDRSRHWKWFSGIQILHYEPIAEALARSEAGSDGTLVFDSAGYIPYVSGFSLIDPIGLTDNVLSGREPITPMEREQYIWGSDPDVYLGPVPAASAGAESGRDDPLVQSEYAQNILLQPVIFASYERFMGKMTYDERLEMLHVRMRELRDRWIAVGEIPYPYPSLEEYTHFLYVRRDSPHADRLVDELGRITTRPIENIDFDNLLDGQRQHNRQSLQLLAQER